MALRCSAQAVKRNTPRPLTLYSRKSSAISCFFFTRTPEKGSACLHLGREDPCGQEQGKEIPGACGTAENEEERSTKLRPGTMFEGLLHHQAEAPAGVLLPRTQAFFESEEGQQGIAVWKAQQEQGNEKQGCEQGENILTDVPAWVLS